MLDTYIHKYEHDRKSTPFIYILIKVIYTKGVCDGKIFHALSNLEKDDFLTRLGTTIWRTQSYSARFLSLTHICWKNRFALEYIVYALLCHSNIWKVCRR